MSSLETGRNKSRSKLMVCLFSWWSWKNGYARSALVPDVFFQNVKGNPAALLLANFDEAILGVEVLGVGIVGGAAQTELVPSQGTEEGDGLANELDAQVVVSQLGSDKTEGDISGVD